MDDKIQSWWNEAPAEERQQRLERLRVKHDENPDDVFDEIALAWAEHFERQRVLN